MAEASVQLILTQEFGTVLFTRRGQADIFVITKDLDFGDTNRMKHFDGIRLEFKDLALPTDLEVQVAVKNNVGDATIWSTGLPITGTMTFIPIRVAGKLLKIKLSALSNSLYFVWSKLEVYGTFTGRRRF